MTDQQQICQGFLAEIEASGIPKAAGEGILHELGLIEASTLAKQSSERAFLALFDHKYATIKDLQSDLIEESKNFREGLKTAMLSEGVEIETINGFFKEAEERFTDLIKGSMEKEAGIGSGVAKFLSGMKAPLRTMAAGGRGFATDMAGQEKFLKSLIPGLTTPGIGLKNLGTLNQLNAGTTRIALGDKLQGLGMRRVGNAVTSSGESAMRNQANSLANQGFSEKFNNLAQQARTEARSPGGVAKATKTQLSKLQAMKVPKTHRAGNVSQDTIQQGIERAKQFSKDPLGAPLMKPPTPGMLGGHMRFTPGKGLGRAAGGALLGGLTMGPVGALGGAAVGGLTGTLGTGGTLAAGAGLYGASKLLGGGSTTKPSEDRNRILPFMGNHWTGGVGGALLGSVVANELGLDGAASWLLPLLGGVAGYNYLPGMMNSFKDPLGQGVNAVPASHQAGNLRNFGYQ